MKNYKVLTCLVLVVVSVIQSSFKKDDKPATTDVQAEIVVQEVEKFSGIYNAAKQLDATQSESLTKACSMTTE